MSTLSLDAQTRDALGTGSSREARRNGLVPAVIYGADAAPASVTMKLNEVNKAINAGKLIGSMLELNIEGKKQKVLTKEIQFHPVKDTPMHVDFFRVTEKTIITVEVPIQLQNEDASPGLKTGGRLNVVRYAIEVKCPAGAIPDHIEVDLGTAEQGDTIHISDVNFPAGVASAITDRDPTILTVVAARGVAAEDNAEKEATEGEEAAADSAEGEA